MTIKKYILFGGIGYLLYKGYQKQQTINDNIIHKKKTAQLITDDLNRIKKQLNTLQKQTSPLQTVTKDLTYKTRVFTTETQAHLQEIKQRLDIVMCLELCQP